MDVSIGVYVIDRFTYYTLEFLEQVNQNSKKTIYELVITSIHIFEYRRPFIFKKKFNYFSKFNCCPKYKCISTVSYRTDLFPRDIRKVLVTEFFGNVRSIELLNKIDKFDSNQTRITIESIVKPEIKFKSFSYFDQLEL